IAYFTLAIDPRQATSFNDGECFKSSSIGNKHFGMNPQYSLLMIHPFRVLAQEPIIDTC
ncbi:3751_t:CDS:1, partial [Funneliformis mosseae]